MAAAPPRPSRRAILALSISATFLAILSTNIINIALPELMRALHATVSEVEWVVTAYMLTFSLLIPVAGWLSDRVGRAPVFASALALFVLGALLAALAPSLSFLIAARVVQAAGASALGPTAMGLLHAHFEPHERGRALGLWAFGATLGPALGPTIGGFLVDHVGWRSIFLLYVPTGLAVLLASVKVLGLKRERGLDGSFDFTGFLGISLLFGGLLLSINRAAHQQSLSGSVGGLLAALAGVALLWRAATHAASPIVDWGLFSRRNYLLALTLGMVRSFGLFGSVFLLPIYLQKVAGLDAMHTALLILPAALSLAAASPLVGRLTGRFDTRLLAPVGIVLISLSMIWLRDLGPVAPLGLIVTSQIVRGLGMSLLITPVMTVAMNDMPGERVGTASGLITITMQLGGALGVAVLNGAMVNRAHALGLSGELLAGDPLAAEAFGHAFQLASLVNFVGLVPALAFLPVAQPSPQQEARA